MIRFIQRGSVVSFVVLAAGCGSPDWPATGLVTGTITRVGKPVAGVDVSFRAAGAPRYGYGTTNQAGRYTLTTFDPNDGAIIGEHVVVLTPANPATVSELSGDVSAPESYEAYKKAVQAASKPVTNPVVPRRYGSPATTPLKATVKPGDNVIDFDLSDG